MDEVSTMTISSAITSSPPGQNPHHENHVSRHTTVSVLAVTPTLSQLPSEAGATVYVAGSNASKEDSPLAWSTVIPKVQPVNGCSTEIRHQSQQPAHVVKIKINPELDNSRVISTVRLTPDQEDPRESGSGDECLAKRDNSCQIVSTRNITNGSGLSSIDSCVRISVVNEAEHQQLSNQRDEMVQRGSTESVNATSNRSSTCFYYGPFQSPITAMVMSSGQCSPSDTLDSGTCSDLDGTPPPLPKKKSSSTVVLGCSGVGLHRVNQHTRTGSLTSSGAEVDSDDNESNISCDSLNSGDLAARVIGEQINKTRELSDDDINASRAVNNNGDARVKRDLEATVDELERVTLNSSTNNNNNEDDVNKNYSETNIVKSSDKLSVSLVDVISSSTRASPSISPSPSGTSSLSKSSSTPRVRSPNPLANGRGHQASSPVVKECTYEERKKEQDRLEQETAAAEHYANYKRDNGTKYVYEDDRFYNFHINELEPVDGDEDLNKRKKLDESETDEYFAGYKILDKEAIRSAKGTVRGVKNRVRAGIATFLQNPSSKNYKQKDAGKVVVYTTSMRVVPKTLIACMKMRQILNTNMVQYEVRDLFGSREFQTELKDRLGIERIEVPQLFIDGQHMGDADAVERLNESGELRPILKPYKYRGVRQVCAVCGGAGAILCISCHGSKKSQSRRWKGFLDEDFALRCMNCDEVGLIRCPNC